MNIVRAMHTMATELSVLAGVSKGKGFHKDASEFYRKAFELEKKAALMTSTHDKDPEAHFILLRSAAALAYKAELFTESEHLIEICKAENPPSWILSELSEIEQLIKTESSENFSDLLEIRGMFTGVNKNGSEITINDLEQQQSYSIIVPKTQIVEIVKNYFFNAVNIQARQTPGGIIILEKISAAA